MKEKVREDLVDLAHAHVTQITDNNVKMDWKVRKNITSEDLFSLPAHLDIKVLETVLEFGRKFELIALNAGIEHGKKITVGVYNKKIEHLQLMLKLASEENERIATILNEHITRNTDGTN